MATTNKNKSTEEKLPESQAKETTAENVDNESSENSAHETAEQTPKIAAEEQEQAEGGGDKSAEGVMAGKKVKLILKHKSNTLHYHRCGLTITKTFAEYEVPAEIVEKLKADKWIEVKEEK
ncbi:MAG: hypothetical protein NC041_07085 [Bacteroides sp.]|nr:hypothetical protein [Prevotella sp.]MCM1407061.1 hypothetical protein [Treponema brennaborense]MCM1470213.1 hypothetical protein [Bacteroides sp.]